MAGHRKQHLERDVVTERQYQISIPNLSMAAILSLWKWHLLKSSPMDPMYTSISSLSGSSMAAFLIEKPDLMAIRVESFLHIALGRRTSSHSSTNRDETSLNLTRSTSHCILVNLIELKVHAESYVVVVDHLVQRQRVYARQEQRQRSELHVDPS
jgi:hypothetical protein